MISFTQGCQRLRDLILAVMMLVMLLVLTGLGSNTTAAEQDTTYAHAAEPIGSVREIYDDQLPPELQINTFRNI